MGIDEQIDRRAVVRFVTAVLAALGGAVIGVLWLLPQNSDSPDLSTAAEGSATHTSKEFCFSDG